ncbi:LLM class flavin-dependent oxidoreductase [Streptomyces sp. XD-27]|nr:LLM class flavin-dependent oxidoreductase [Streptomyces sp. XD-27]WKX74072.1 LLM class flavin-dependent oxidoreductase [Streptomyces sp. XD-27]
MGRGGPPLRRPGRGGVRLRWNPQDFALAPQRFAEAKEEMRRGIGEVLRLWSGAAVERTGPGGRRYPVRTYPTPRHGGLPLWITAAGSPQTYALAGELGAGVLTHLLGQSLDELEENLAGYTDALTTHSHGMERERVCVMVHTHLGPDRQRALNLARGPLMAYMRSSLSLFGLKSAAPADDSTGDKALEELLELAYQDFSRDRCLLGSPADALPLIEALAEIGGDEIGCLIDFGIGTDEVLHGLETLAELNRRCAELSAPRIRVGTEGTAAAAGPAPRRRLGRAVSAARPCVRRRPRSGGCRCATTCSGSCGPTSPWPTATGPPRARSCAGPAARSSAAWPTRWPRRTAGAGRSGSR